MVVMDDKLAGMNETMYGRLGIMNEKLDLNRRELLAEIRAALK